MIVIDSSAIVAIIMLEAEAEACMTIMARNRGLVSAMTAFESGTVILGRKQAGAVHEVRDLVTFHSVQMVPFDDSQAMAAFEACARFSKGIQRARLNLCDCAAYALAKSRGLLLL